jgi:hypothetical protein
MVSRSFNMGNWENASLTRANLSCRGRVGAEDNIHGRIRGGAASISFSFIFEFPSTALSMK